MHSYRIVLPAALLLMALSAHAQPVNTSAVVGKVICGYQGWFTCHGDGSPVASWRHWNAGVYQSDLPKPMAGNVTFELYPDVSAYGSNQLFQTALAPLGDGRPAQLFSSYQQATINQHFAWMEAHGIDGVALQRFIAETYDGVFKAHRDSVAARVKRAAELHQRGFYIMYDISGFDPAQNNYLKADWTNTMSNALQITNSPAYFRQDGKPVIAIWGIGFGHIAGDTTQAMDLINWFKNQGFYVIGGVPTHWRNGVGDSKPGFDKVYKSLDMISPWTVGRYRTPDDADHYKNNFLIPDLAYCNANGMVYQPVISPGSAWSNWNSGPPNDFPRLAGNFFWRQAYNARSVGATSLYVAMFDEYDESTAIMPAADSYFSIPTDQYFLTLSADGKYVSSDFYLRLTGEITELFHGNIPNAPTFSTPLSVGPVFFRTSVENGLDAMPDWSNTPDPSSVLTGVSGPAPGGIPECRFSSLKANSGNLALRLAGNDNSPLGSFAYYQVFDVNIPVDADTRLRFWSFPENALSRHVSLDLVMTDGSNLRDSGAKDTNDMPMHPGAGRGVVGQWTETNCHIGQWLTGKTIDRIMIAYDYGPLTGAFSAFIDDISIYQKSASSPTEEAFSTTLAQPLHIAPNPVQTSSLRISLRNSQPESKARIRIFDATGMLKGTYDLTGAEVWEVSTANWPAGIYWASVEYGERITTQKIVKMR